MLKWKKIQERWHLTYEDISVCRLAQQMAIQSNSAICPACLDTIADERLQWQNLNLSKLMTKLVSPSLPEDSTSANDADRIS